MNETQKPNIADEFHIEEALTRSAFWPALYQRDHAMERSEESREAMSTLAMARLEWILRQGRRALNGLITEGEFVTLCTVFNSEIATPDDIEHMANEVAEEFDIEYNGYKETPLGPLLDKLLTMSPIQKLALRDLVQRFWYPADGRGISPSEFLNKNGVAVAESD